VEAADAGNGGNDSEQRGGGERGRRAVKRAADGARKASLMGNTGRRAQQAARYGVDVGKEAAQRTADAARKRAGAALPRVSDAGNGAREWMAVNPEVAEQVTVALLAAVMGAAGKHSAKAPHVALKVALAGLGAVAPVVATHTGRQVRKGFEVLGRTRSARTADALDTSGPSRQETPGPQGAGVAGTAGELPSVPAGMPLAELADQLGVRQPPDPGALYEDGPAIGEPLFPLPGDLALLPWNSLDRRNRFFVLVAAWTLRESEGIQLLKAGRLDRAGEVFKECLSTAEYIQARELIFRSCEDLRELAAVSGDAAASRKWQAEAERAHGSSG
jgi:hypothetical protein